MSQILGTNQWPNVKYHGTRHDRAQDQVRKTFGHQPNMPGAPDPGIPATAAPETASTL